MKELKSILAISLLAFFLANCSKSSDNPPPPKTKAQLLTQASWKFDNAKVGGVDVSALLKPCEKDNVIVFVSPSTGTLDEGASKCNSADPQTVPFTWNFANNDQTLHVSTVLFAGGSSDFTIVDLSETQLILSQIITVSGTPQNAVVTFKH